MSPDQAEEALAVIEMLAADAVRPGRPEPVYTHRVAWLRQWLQEKSAPEPAEDERLVKRSASGRRIGESHPRAVLLDHEVEMMRELHEAEGFGYRRLAKKFEVPRDTVRDICRYRTRRGV